MKDRNEHDHNYFTQLIKENHGSIYRICRAYLYDASYADDLYQEVLYQIWKSWKGFKGNSKPSTWIYRVAVNTAIGFNTKNKRQQFDPLPDSFDVPYRETITEMQEHEQSLDKLRFCIGQLALQDRLVISLVLEQKSYKEIAEITGATLSNTGVRINRIKERLVTLMQDKKI